MLDVVVANGSGTVSVLLNQLSSGNPWTDLGHALGGMSGEPTLEGSGSLLPAPTTVIPLLVDGAGQVSLVLRVPSNPPAGEAYLQCWVKDPGGPQGFSASNALPATMQ